MTPRITRHSMPDVPPERPRKSFTLNPDDFPPRYLPRLMGTPPAGRLVLKAAIRAPIFDPGDSIEAYRHDIVAEEQAALRMRRPVWVGADFGRNPAQLVRH